MNWLLLLGSVTGVLGLAFAARLLGLGGGAIADEAQARRLAEDSQLAFSADEVFLSTDGDAALVRSADDRWVVLKVHGAQVAARELKPPLEVSRTEEGVVVATGDRMFGAVRVALDAEGRNLLMARVTSSQEEAAPT